MLPLVCIDVDGTLVGSVNEPSAPVWAAAAAAVERGQHLAICTARIAAGPTRRWAERLDPSGWHAFHNGAALLQLRTGETRLHPLSNEDVARIAAVADDRDWVLEHYSLERMITASDAPLARVHARLLGLEHRPGDPGQLAGAVVRVQLVLLETEVREALAVVPAHLAASAASSPVMPGAAFISITSALATKAKAVVELAGLHGVDLDQVMMVGDGHNDAEVMALVGHGTAMANATPETIAAARHHVGDVDRDGLVEALALSADL